jgi:hypothetical protein
MKSTFENLPTHLLLRILKYFQTNIICTDKDKIIQKRKNLARGLGIQTDIKTLVNLANSSKFWLNFFRQDGLVFFVVYYDSIRKIPKNLRTYVHCSYCHVDNCQNVCHYVTKDIKYSNVFKKIRMHHLSREKSTKQKNNYQLNDSTQSSKSKELDTLSTDSDNSDCIL